MKFYLVISLVCLGLVGVRAEEERLLISAKINGAPVQLMFDTGCGATLVLFEPAARQLGLNVAPPSGEPAPGDVACGITEPCELDFGTTHVRSRLAVMAAPPQIQSSIAGALGWPALSNSVFSIDAIADQIDFLSSVPPKSRTWTKYPLRGDTELLGFDATGSNSTKAQIILDPGAPNGVALGSFRWRLWKMAHLQQPVTLNARYTPAAGLVVKQEGWSPELTLGTLALTEVPIIEANRSQSSSDSEYGAWLGLAALKRLNLIVDGPGGVVYVQPKSTPALPYEHNRLGAVFVPRSLQGESTDLVAHVMIDSPAQIAGLHNWDILLKIDDLEVTHWRTDPTILPLSRFWSRPAGTTIQLTLKRRERIFTTTVRLRNILPPDPRRHRG